VYRFFAGHLALSPKPVARPDGSIDESGVVIEKTEALRVFDAGHPRPPGALKDGKAVAEALFAKRAKPPRPAARPPDGFPGAASPAAPKSGRTR